MSRLAAGMIVVLVAGAWRVTAQGAPPLQAFIAAASQDDREARAALDAIAAGWKDGYAAMIVDVARLMQPARRSRGADAEQALDYDDGERELGRAGGEFPSAPPPDPPGARIRRRLVEFLQRQTGQRFGDDLRRWRAWMWALPYDPHPEYGRYKGIVYANIDPRMAAFFAPGVPSEIRLDEIDWGGIGVNGIPPLDHPKIVKAAEARYLRDSHVVFGTVVNGEARAYPKRILGWHEMALDRLGGVELTVVYCTLCGTAIPYESVAAGAHRTFGTSGLLYRSNKLMFDRETNSLWSTLEGRPVVGPLAGRGIELTPHWMVTTTWAEWRREHPGTTVLSIDTGFDRNYSEGAAYRDYFATDRLMFAVPKVDRRLKNKAEVVAFRLPGADGRDQAVAISADMLRRSRLFQASPAGVPIVVVTSAAGANRVYRAEGVRFASLEADGRLRDAGGGMWRPTADALVLEPDGARLPAVASFRAFWFGWYAQFPDTILVK